MVCHSCGKTVDPDQRFCSGCGASLRGVTDPTEIVGETIATTPPTEQWAMDDPEWAATGVVPVTAAASVRSSLDAVPEAPLTPETEVVLGDDDVWAAASGAFVPDPVELQPSATAEMPRVYVSAPGFAPPLDQQRFRFGAVLLFGVLSAVVGLIGAFTTIVGITSDTTLIPTAQTPPTFRSGTWKLDDLGGNLSIAMLIAALLMVAGGVAAGFRWRWGSGLAGGAGLATAGLAALMVGLAEIPIDTAKEFAAIPSDQVFTLTLTRDVGYWLLVVAAALGVLVFFAAFNEAFGDRRPGLNPWIAAVGALATLVAAAGPMLAEGQAIFSDNWYLIEGPGNPSAVLVAGRLLQLVLLVVTGVFGYLCVRRWGLGLAIGGALPFVWMAISTLFDLTDNPVGPAYRNPGAVDNELHGMTIIGVSAVAAIAVLAVIAAYDQGVRERRS